MSEKSNKILSGIVCVLLLSACNRVIIPAEYKFSPRMVKREVTGSWIEINRNSKAKISPEISLSGELISIQNDSIFVLTQEGLRAIDAKKTEEAIVYNFVNQGGAFGALTFLTIVPNIIGEAAVETGFLGLGLPMAIFGSILAIKERRDESNMIIYPERSRLEELSKYARFPKGIPPEVERSKLQLIRYRVDY